MTTKTKPVALFDDRLWFAFEWNTRYGSGNRLLRFRGTHRLADVCQDREGKNAWYFGNNVTLTTEQLAAALGDKDVYVDYDRSGTTGAIYRRKGKPVVGARAILAAISVLSEGEVQDKSNLSMADDIARMVRNRVWQQQGGAE